MPKKDLYRSKAWQRNRVAFALSRYCICERCNRPVYVSGITDYIPKENRLRYVVHHKEYLNEGNYTNDKVAYDWNNLELLCIDCHNEEHKKQSATRDGLMFDEFGNLIKCKEVRHFPSNPPTMK